MKITEAIIYLKQAEKRTEKKSQKKHYKTFIAILTDLQSKELDENQFLEIEKQLNNLQLDSKSTFKQLNRNFSKLKEFLKVKFSLIEEGHYTSIGIALGMALGMCFGLAFESLVDKSIWTSAGMTIGMAIGIIIGKKMDSKAEIEGRALKTKLV